MRKRVPTKVAIVALLVGATLLGNGAPATGIAWGLILGLLAIGIFNAVVSPPGTFWIRGLSVACTFIGLLFPDGPRAVVVFLMLLVWPPAYVTAWAVAREKYDEDLEASSPRSAARSVVAAIIVAVALAVIAYRLIFTHQLQQTAALFVGLPTLLAVVVVLFVSPRSATGVACKAVTVGLLMSLTFLGEGMLCVLMSAPLFYGFAVGIGAAADAARNFRARNRMLYSSALLLMIGPMGLEGVTNSLSFRRNETVTAARIVRASAQNVEKAVFEQPRFDRPMPLPLLAGFPRPDTARIDGSKVRWIIRMRGGEMRLNGMEPRGGDLVLELDESRPGLVRWRALSDDSHMTHFLSWQSATVEWAAIDGQTTRVMWTLQYRRGLDPAWYFGPWERYIAMMAAEYLIDAVATP